MHRLAVSVASATTLVLATLACSGGGGGVGTKDTCVQVGPPQGYPLRVADLFIATGHPEGSPNEVLTSWYGGQLSGLTPNQYPQLCFDSHPPDRPNYHWVGWVDGFFYADGGVPLPQTYCSDLRDAGCAPQPGQLHGEVVMTLREGANNVVVIPLSP